jgi:chromosome segregation ATPase
MMAEAQRQSWIQNHGKIVLVLAGLLLVVGVTTAVIGVVALVGARDDLTAAEARLDEAQDRLAEVDQEAGVAEDGLAEASREASRLGQRLLLAEDRRAETAREGRLVADGLEAARPVAAGTLTAAEEIAAAGRELSDSDTELSTLQAQHLQAAKDGRYGEYNRLSDQLDSWAEKADTFQAQIDEAIFGIQRVTAPEDIDTSV